MKTIDNMKNYIAFVITLVQVLCIKESYGYRGGAPIGACETLTPQHNASPSTAASPYTIGTKEDQSGQIIVTISSSDDRVFKGFILQARKVGEEKPVGEFVSIPDNTQEITCTNPKVSRYTDLYINLGW